MGSYDAAIKVILAHCREAALEFFLGLDVAESEGYHDGILCL